MSMTKAAPIASAIGVLALFPGTSLAHCLPGQGQPTLIAQSVPQRQGQTVVLPGRTPVLLSLNDELSTKGDWMVAGHTFSLSVVHDVMLDDHVIISAGSRASGTVTWLTDKGMFGKSGKFDIKIDYVEVGNQRVPLEGSFRQEGEGNTVATIGAVLMSPVAGLFVTGRSGRMAKGKELTALTGDDVSVRIPESVPAIHAPAVEGVSL